MIYRRYFERTSALHRFGRLLWLRLAAVLVLIGAAALTVALVHHPSGAVPHTLKQSSIQSAPPVEQQENHSGASDTNITNQTKEESNQTMTTLHIQANHSQQTESSTGASTGSRSTSKTTLTVNGKPIDLPQNGSIDKTIYGANGSTLHISAESSSGTSTSGSSSDLQITSNSESSN